MSEEICAKLLTVPSALGLLSGYIHANSLINFHNQKGRFAATFFDFPKQAGIPPSLLFTYYTDEKSERKS